MSLIYDFVEDGYVEFIVGIRDKVRHKDRLAHGLPIIPFGTDLSTQCIYVELREGSLCRGTLTLRRSDLRLLEYRDPYGNSIDIGELGLYESDGWKLEISELEGLQVGSSNLLKAVSFLVNFKTDAAFSTVDTIADLKSSLALLCVVVCEATKFEILCKMFDSAFKSAYEIPLCSWMFKLMDNWEYLSKELVEADFHHENDPQCDYYIPRDRHDWYVDERWVIGVTCQDVVKCLGILRECAPCEVMSIDFDQGICLLQIYSVSVYVNGGGCRSVYGTMSVYDEYETYYMYNRGQSHPELIESRGTLTLKDPQGFVNCSSGHIYIKLNLMEGDGTNVSKGTLVYGGLSGEGFKNSLLSAMVRGDNGYAVLYYSVFECAVQAVVEATLVVESSSDGSVSSFVHKNHICVCGSLVAQYGGLLSNVAENQKKYFQTALFYKHATETSNEAGECSLKTGECSRGLNVELGSPIKLMRSVVSVPVDCPLIIIANLKSCDGKPIVSGFSSWTPGACKSATSTIPSKTENSFVLRACRKNKSSIFLQVKVTWLTNRVD